MHTPLPPNKQDGPPKFKAGDCVRASEMLWFVHNGPNSALRALRPVREVVDVTPQGVFVRGSLTDAADKTETPVFWPCYRWDDLELVSPPPVGLDKPEVASPAVKPDKPESVLAEALRCTDGARQRDYGSAKVNHERIAAFWMLWDICRSGSEATIERTAAALRECAASAELGSDNTADDVAIKMILLKIARHANTPKRDNLVDIAGYARCSSRINGFED